MVCVAGADVSEHENVKTEGVCADRYHWRSTRKLFSVIGWTEPTSRAGICILFKRILQLTITSRSNTINNVAVMNKYLWKSSMIIWAFSTWRNVFHTSPKRVQTNWCSRETFKEAQFCPTHNTKEMIAEDSESSKLSLSAQQEHTGSWNQEASASYNGYWQ